MPWDSRHQPPAAVIDLLATTGRSAGPVREPWSIYTVEGLFDAAETAARRDDVVQVAFDGCLGYPRSMRGDVKLGLPDDWYRVTVDRLLLRP